MEAYNDGKPACHLPNLNTIFQLKCWISLLIWSKMCFFKTVHLTRVQFDLWIFVESKTDNKVDGGTGSKLDQIWFAHRAIHGALYWYTDMLLTYKPVFSLQLGSLSMELLGELFTWLPNFFSFSKMAGHYLCIVLINMRYLAFVRMGGQSNTPICLLSYSTFFTII